MTPPSKRDLLQLIGATLGVSSDEIKPDQLISDIPGWDSIAWISIITAIEGRTGKAFPIDRIDDIRSVGDLLTVAQD